MNAYQTQLAALQRWLSSSAGQALWQREYQQFAHYAKQIPARRVLQLGVSGRPGLDQIWPTLVGPSECPGLEASLEQAELHVSRSGRHSMDLVVLPHGLDTVEEAQAQALLEAVCQVLTPSGYLLLSGFNPWSLWGIWRAWRLAPRSAVPWQKPFHSRRRLTRILAQLECAVKHTQSVYFSFPLPGYDSKAMEALGRVWWPRGGAVYMMLVQKQSLPLQPIAKPAFAPSPAMRVAQGNFSASCQKAQQRLASTHYNDKKRADEQTR